MNRRNFLKTSSSFIAATALLTCQTKTRKPNIVLIMADDLGYECIGANGGSSYQTPYLDKLAETGMRFEHCYAQPLCTPSRVKIMTGIYNVRNYKWFGVLDREATTFAQLFKDKNYETCIAGKWQLGKESDSPQHFGFDESCLWQQTKGRTDKTGHDSRYPNPLLDINGELTKFENGEFGPDIASDFICDFIERKKDNPFLVYYPMILTHCPFIPTPDSNDWDPKNPGSLDYKGNVKYFGDMVTYMDKIVGKIVRKLDDLNLTENTLILFTGDNGTDIPVVSRLNGQDVAGAKGKTTDAGTRVPLIANWKNQIEPGQTNEDLVDFSDFLPTLCEAADIPVPDALQIDGRSFMPQLLGQKGNPREWTYCWFSRNGHREDAQIFARNKRYKLYQTGQFYDIQKDVLEKHPLNTNELNTDIITIKNKLQKVLDKYKDSRPDNLN